MGNRKKSGAISAVHTRERGEDGRPEDDNYPSPPAAVRALLHHERPFLDGAIWDPFAGAGVLMQVVRDEGLECYGSTLIDYGHPDIAPGIDYSRQPLLSFESVRKVLTNPPYGLMLENDARLLERMLDQLDYVAMLMSTSFEESQGRLERIFMKRAPSIIYQFADRLTMIPHRLWEGRDDPQYDQGATPFAWYVWRRPYHPPPSPKVWIKWKDYARDGDLERYQVTVPEHKGRKQPRLL